MPSLDESPHNNNNNINNNNRRLTQQWLLVWFWVGVLSLLVDGVHGNDEGVSTLPASSSSSSSSSQPHHPLSTSSSSSSHEAFPFISFIDGDTNAIVAAPDCSDPQKNRLECWLWSLEIVIPNQQFKDWVTIDISRMVCTNFQLKTLTSNYDNNNNNNNNHNNNNGDDGASSEPTLQVSAGQLAATCHGHYHASGGFSGDVRASVVQASHKNALEVVFQLSSSTSTWNDKYDSVVMPEKFTTTDCQTHLEAHGIHFTGSMSAKLIQAFAKTIGKYITQALHENVCPLMHQQLDPLVTKYVQNFDDWAKQYIMVDTENDALQSAGNDDDDVVEDHSENYETRAETNTMAMMSRRRSRSLSHAEFTSNLRRSEEEEKEDEVAVSLHGIEKNASLPVNPQDFDVVHWALEFFNSQLQDHLQTGWFFGKTSSCKVSKDCQNMFRGISGWLVSLLGETIDIVLPAYFHNISLPLPLGTSGSIGMERLYIDGLDLLDALQVLVPSSGDNDTDLQSILSTHRGFHVRVPIRVVFQMPHAKHPLEESLQVSVNISKLETTLSTLIEVIDWDTTTVLQVVDAFQDYVDTHDWRSVSCLVRTFDFVQLTDWATTIFLKSVSVSRTTKNHALEDEIDDVINTAMDLAATEYQEMWTQLFDGLVQGPGRRHLQVFLDQWIEDHKSVHECPSTPDTHGKPKWMNFTKVDILYKMNAYFNHQHTRKTMDHFLECVGKWVVERVTNSTEIFSNMEMKYWNQLQEFVLLEPSTEQPNVLSSSIDWGTTTTTTKGEDRLATTTTTTTQSTSNNLPQTMVTVEIPNFNATVNVTAFANLHALVGTQLDYNLNLLRNVTLAHLLQQGQCAVLPAMEFRLLPDSVLQSTLGLNVSAVVNGTYMELSSKDYDVATEFLDTVMNWSVEWVRQLGNQLAEEVLANSPDTCPGIVAPADDDNDDDGDDKKKNYPDKDHLPWNRNPIVWLLVFVLCLSQYALVFIAQGPTNGPGIDGPPSSSSSSEQRDRNSRALISESMEEVCINPLEEGQDGVQQSILDDMRDMDRALLGDIRDQIDQEHDRFILEGQDEVLVSNPNDISAEDDDPKTLLMETQLSGLVRFILPALIVATMVLLFSSNVSVGASVDMSVKMEDHRFQLPGLFEFSLGNTVTELFQAGIYPLFLLVVVFSGIWPYAKLALMLYVWIVPYEDVHQREQRLLVLDALSKFSLVDTYVLVVMLVAFRFHLEITETLGLDIFVTPKYGFYAFLLATSLSLVMGHGMLYFHRRALARKAERSVDETSESIWSHAFDMGDNGQRRRLSCFFTLLFVLAAMSAIGLLVVGFTLETFSFEFGGLAGMALGERSQTSYSLISLGLAIPKSVENPGSPAVLLLQLAYYFYAVVTPLSCLIFLIVLFIWPMSLSKQQKILVGVEIANAWSAVEVFVLSIGAALLQISTFASFIIGDRCDIINMLLRDATGADEGVCFTVDASLEQNFWYLFAGALLNSFVVSLGLRFAHLAMDERLSGTVSGEWTLAKRLFRLPAIGCIVFSSAVVSAEAPGEGEGENGSEAAEWRHWF